MYSMGKVSRRTSPNLVENSKKLQMVEVVEAVEALETHPSPVEKVRKFHYLQTFAEAVAKADIKKDNPVNKWKQCVGTNP